MTYLATFNAPALEDVKSTLRWQLEAGIVFHARQVPNLPQAGRLLFAYVIVTDKAVREYRAGHGCISEHMAAGGGIRAFVEGVGHFENCINSTKRALRLLTRLANNPDVPALDRTVRRLAHVWSNEVTSVRDTIEHIDDDIMSVPGLPDGSAAHADYRQRRIPTGYRPALSNVRRPNRHAPIPLPRGRGNDPNTSHAAGPK